MTSSSVYLSDDLIRLIDNYRQQPIVTMNIDGSYAVIINGNIIRCDINGKIDVISNLRVISVAGGHSNFPLLCLTAEGYIINIESNFIMYHDPDILEIKVLGDDIWWIYKKHIWRYWDNTIISFNSDIGQIVLFDDSDRNAICLLFDEQANSKVYHLDEKMGRVKKKELKLPTNIVQINHCYRRGNLVFTTNDGYINIYKHDESIIRYRIDESFDNIFVEHTDRMIIMISFVSSDGYLFINDIMPIKHLSYTTFHIDTDRFIQADNRKVLSFDGNLILFADGRLYRVSKGSNGYLFDLYMKIDIMYRFK